MKYHLILTSEGHVEPMNAQQAPTDIHEFIGYRLPDEVYYYISRGLIADSTLNTLLSSYGAEYPPLCNGETEEYRKFLTTDIMKMKAQTMSLMKSQLNSFFNRKISIVHWYDHNSPTAEHVIKADNEPVSIETISNWKSGKQSVEKELKKAGVCCSSNSPSMLFSSCFHLPGARYCFLTIYIYIYSFDSLDRYPKPHLCLELRGQCQ